MRAVAAALVLSACALAGCSTTAPGTPVPTRDTPTATGEPTTEPPTTEPGGSTVPPVTDPLDTAAFQADPCTSLTDAQAAALGVESPGAPRPGPAGKSCFWQNSAGGSIGVLWSGTGLAAVYESEERGDTAYFEPRRVGGQPAVAAEPSDDRDSGACSVHVGTSDEAMFTLALQQSRDKVGDRDPCDVAADVAGQVLTTIKGA